MERSLALALSQVILDVARDPGSEATDGARNRLLHGLGVAFRSIGLPASEVAWRTMEPNAGECRVIGRNRTLTAEAAAFVNAVAAHNSLQEDCGPGGLAEGSHPGTYVLPAALAVAEQLNASGPVLVSGIIAGYEAVSRLGAGAPPEIVQRGFRPVPVMAPIGAAAAAAVIRGATSEQLATALALAANSSSGFGQGILEGSMDPYFHAGFGARNGMLAAELALAGAVAARESLEGSHGFFHAFAGTPEDPDAMLAPRQSAGVNRVGSKRFAACLQNQQTMALALDEIAPAFVPELVSSIRLRRPAKGTNGVNSPGVDAPPPYASMLQTQMAARFTAAAALLGRPVDDVRYFATASADAEAVALAELIDLEESSDDSVSFDIAYLDGSRQIHHSDSSAGLFPSSDVIRERFVERAVDQFGPEGSEILAVIDDLGNLRDTRRLTALLGG